MVYLHLTRKLLMCSSSSCISFALEHSAGLMCWSVEDIVLCRKVVMVVPMEVLVCVGRFPVNRG